MQDCFNQVKTKKLGNYEEIKSQDLVRLKESMLKKIIILHVEENNNFLNFKSI